MKKYLLIISLAAMALTACNENPATKVGNPLGTIASPVESAKAMMEKGLVANPVQQGSSEYELFINELFSLKFDVASGKIHVSSTKITEPVTVSGLVVAEDGSFTAKDEASGITVEGSLDEGSDKYPLVITVTKSDGKKTGRFFASSDVNSFNNFNKPVDEGCSDADATLKDDSSKYVASFVDTPDMTVFDHCKDAGTLVEMSCGSNGSYVANIVECDCVKGKCVDVSDEDLDSFASDEDVCGSQNWACIQKKMMEGVESYHKWKEEEPAKLHAAITSFNEKIKQQFLNAHDAMKDILK